MLIASDSHTAHLLIRGIFMDSMYHLMKMREYRTGKGEDRSVSLLVFSFFVPLSAQIMVKESWKIN